MASVARLIKLIQANLTPELLVGRWQHQSHPLKGHCYVGAEALWHLLGRDKWKPVYASYTDECVWARIVPWFDQRSFWILNLPPMGGFTNHLIIWAKDLDF